MQSCATKVTIESHNDNSALDIDLLKTRIITMLSKLTVDEQKQILSKYANKYGWQITLC